MQFRQKMQLPKILDPLSPTIKQESFYTFFIHTSIVVTSQVSLSNGFLSEVGEFTVG